MPTPKLLLFLLLFGCQVARAQMVYPFEAAIIEDADGYTNVRQGAGNQAPIVRKVLDNEPFWYNTEEYASNQEWIRVEVVEGKFLGKSSVTGYMHRSRLRPLSKLPIYKGKGFSFKQTTVPFQKTAHRISYREGSVRRIDGDDVLGTDGNLPRRETAKLAVTVAGQPVNVPKSLYRNLYECSPEFSVYRNGQHFFVEQFNSDGAGGYAVVWVFNDSGLVRRLIALGE